jgi:hypothetical protein
VEGVVAARRTEQVEGAEVVLVLVAAEAGDNTSNE